MRKRIESTSGMEGRDACEFVFPEALGAEFPFSRASAWAQPAVLIAYCDTCASLAGLRNHFFGLEAPKGMPMMRKACSDGHLRIIGVPRRSVAKYSGGLPMMRFAQRSCVYRIIGMPSAPSCIFRRRTANDAVVTTGCALPHHWHASHVFCIVLACIC